MAQGDGLIQGGGDLSLHSQVRRSKVRKYYRRVDLRTVMRPYQESPDDVRRDELCRRTAAKLRTALKKCSPYVGTNILRHLKNVNNEDQFERVLDEVWSFAEERRILLIA